MALVIEAAGCIAVMRTESSIVAGGRIPTIIKDEIIALLTEIERTCPVKPCFISARAHTVEAVFVGTVEVR